MGQEKRLGGPAPKVTSLGYHSLISLSWSLTLSLPFLSCWSQITGINREQRQRNGRLKIEWDDECRFLPGHLITLGLCYSSFSFLILFPFFFGFLFSETIRYDMKAKGKEKVKGYGMAISLASIPFRLYHSLFPPPFQPLQYEWGNGVGNENEMRWTAFMPGFFRPYLGLALPFTHIHSSLHSLTRKHDMGNEMKWKEERNKIGNGPSFPFICIHWKVISHYLISPALHFTLLLPCQA